MLKLLCLVMVTMVTGCTTAPYTQADYERDQAISQALSGFGQQLQQQQRRPSQQSCTVQDMGNGYYQQNCQQY